jgi:hypothetical protein
MKFDLKELTEQEVAVLFQALGELPLKISGPIYGKIQTQVLEQQNAKKAE